MRWLGREIVQNVARTRKWGGSHSTPPAPIVFDLLRFVNDNIKLYNVRERRVHLKGALGIATWGIGIRKIQLKAHCCQTFLCKMQVKRVLYCWIAKAVWFYKSNPYCQILLNVAKKKFWFKIILTKITSFSKIHYFINKKLYFPL